MNCTTCPSTNADPSTGSCSDCERRYQDSLANGYAAGHPRSVQVGTAFGAPVCIEVHHEAKHCGCKGHGWHSTEYDSWHACPEPGHKGPHPEYPVCEPCNGERYDSAGRACPECNAVERRAQARDQAEEENDRRGAEWFAEDPEAKERRP